MKTINGKRDVDQRFEIRLSGSGGQGLILAGVMLATAIGVGDGKNVVQTQSYGPEARGGASRADVVISDVSPRISGIWEVDHARQINLASISLRLASKILKNSGNFFELEKCFL